VTDRTDVKTALTQAGLHFRCFCHSKRQDPLVLSESEAEESEQFVILNAAKNLISDFEF